MVLLVMQGMLNLKDKFRQLLEVIHLIIVLMVLSFLLVKEQLRHIEILRILMKRMYIIMVNYLIIINTLYMIMMKVMEFHTL